MSLFERDMPIFRKYYKRLANEMNLIIEKNFVEVFIQVKEILSMTTDFPHIIRGSAGCSLVCYLMKITHMDPIKLNINLTRFIMKDVKTSQILILIFPLIVVMKFMNVFFKRYRNRVVKYLTM